MTKYVINGGKTLNGEVTISGAKNAAVAIVPAALLADGPVRIENVPKIIDVTLQLEIMRELGAQIRLVNATTVEIQNTSNPSLKPHELERKAARLLLSARRAAGQIRLRRGRHAGRLQFRRLCARSTQRSTVGDPAQGRLHPRRGARRGPARRTHLFRRCLGRRDDEHHARRGAGQGPDHHGELRQGAAHRRSGELPQRHGRERQGRGHGRDQDPRRRAPARRELFGHPGPDRGRHLYGGGRGLRRLGADQKRHPASSGVHHCQAQGDERRGDRV